jgi:hypothetical protein
MRITRSMVTTTRTRTRNRRGISLLETLFAVGVLMVGLLGITAVLSTAGKNAVDSRTLAHSQLLANSWLNEMYARNIQNPANWVRPVFNSGTSSWDWVGMGTLSPETAFNASYCIDPLGFAFSPAISRTDSNYSADFFPYYRREMNPLVDPTIAASNIAGVEWSSVPRMSRVSLGVPGTPAGAKLAEEIFASQHEIAELTSQDSTRHVLRGYESVGGAIQKTATKQEYSWMATLTPKDNNQNSFHAQYILSIVVLKNRDRVLEIPAPTAAGIGDPTLVPSGETIAWVVPLGTGSSTGFNGGGGGRVLLVASAATASHTSAGQWIMLSRFDRSKSRGVYGWFRIATCDQDARLMTVGSIPAAYGTGSLNLPFGAGAAGLPVWVREVTLAGRDWGMFPALGIPYDIANPQNDNEVTTATMVRGVVNVHERVITLDAN